MNILNFIIESTICLILFVSFYKIFLSRSKYFTFNRFYLLTSLLVSAIIPFVSINIGNSSNEYIIVLSEITISENANKLLTSNLGEDSLILTNIFYAIYLVVFTLLIFRFGIQLISLKRYYKKLKISTENNSLKIIETNKNISPFSFFNTIILGKYSTEREKQHIVSHELGHIKNLHSIDKLYTEIFTAFFWYNPFVWVLKNELYLVHEYQADSCTVDKSNKVSYMNTLLNLASNNQSNKLINYFNQSFIKRRFKMITNEKIQKGKFSKLFFSIAFALAVGFVFASTNTNGEVQQNNKAKENIETLKSVVDEKVVFEQDDDPPIYTIVEEMPKYPGGQNAMISFLASNIKYPESAKKNGITGTSFISFTVMKDGSIKNVKVLRGFNEECDNEAMRVVKAMPNWEPGKEKGKTVDVQYNIPISFKLDKKK